MIRGIIRNGLREYLQENRTFLDQILSVNSDRDRKWHLRQAIPVCDGNLEDLGSGTVVHPSYSRVIISVHPLKS